MTKVKVFNNKSFNVPSETAVMISDKAILFRTDSGEGDDNIQVMSFDFNTIKEIIQYLSQELKE